jgi:IPT/TIG domain
VPLTIVLPQKLVAGETATLAVIGPNGRLVPDIQIEFSGGVRFTTDATGRVRFRAPAGAGVVLAEIPGSSAVASATVLDAAPSSKFSVLAVPRILSLRDRFTVSGSGFSGDADANSVELGGRPAVVIAASPLSLAIVAGPGAAPGPGNLVVRTNGAEATATTTLVALEFISAKARLAPKEKAKLVVRVVGAEQPLELEVRNLSPDVVRFRRGDLQRVRTRGGPDNIAEIEVRGIRAGDYTFNARVVPPPEGSPDTEAARQYLLAAQRLAPVKDARRVAKLIQRLERRPQGSVKVRNELERMLAKKPEGDYGRLIEAAWEILLNR